MKTLQPFALLAALLAATPALAQRSAEPELPPPVAPAAGNPGPAIALPQYAPPSDARIVYEETPQGVVARYVTPDGKTVQVIPAPNRNAFGGGRGFNFAPHVSHHDPEAAKLHEAEMAAAREAQQLAQQLRGAAEEKQRTELKGKLKESLEQQFDAQQKRRAMEVSKIEERLAKLKETMKKRETAKETIVGRRLDELTGVTDDLGWEDTPGFGGGPGGGYGLPGKPIPVLPYPVPPAPAGAPRGPGAGPQP